MQTRSEMEAFVQHLEQGYRMDIQSVKTELQATCDKTSEPEESITALSEVVYSHDQQMNMQESHMHALYSPLEDQDNENWWSNIRI